jgi:hypothetical protein
MPNTNQRLTLNDLPEQCTKNYPDPQPVIITEHRKTNWIEAHPEHLRPQAASVVKKIRRVSFVEFKYKLLATVNKFNDFLAQQDNQNYAIYFSQPGETSCYWVMALIFEHLTIKPCVYIY